MLTAVIALFEEGYLKLILWLVLREEVVETCSVAVGRDVGCRGVYCVLGWSCVPHKADRDSQASQGMLGMFRCL